MRQIVLDTETTGLDHRQGHRIIEVAGVELINRRLTNRHFHKYVNPQRDIDAGAQAVHGITREFLADKPLFADIVDEFFKFVDGAELVIHNAPFDVGFLNAELNLLGRPPVGKFCPQVLDTLKMAKELHPGKRNNLDALCDRYAIDNAHRVLHGALLDAEILADVYLAMTRGQDSLIVEEEATSATQAEAAAQRRNRPPLKVIVASADELAAHETLLAAIDKESKGQCIWLADRKEAVTETP
jgi:DNA polymerase III subunit epsilon